MKFKGSNLFIAGVLERQLFFSLYYAPPALYEK